MPALNAKLMFGMAKQTGAASERPFILPACAPSDSGLKESQTMRELDKPGPFVSPDPALNFDPQSPTRIQSHAATRVHHPSRRRGDRAIASLVARCRVNYNNERTLS
jgi:hypothetical protein